MLFEKKNIIKEILSKYDIVSTLSQFLKLKKHTYGFFSVCPFHKENTPSFYINQTLQKYYCFGCNKHGDLINFVIEYKKCSFKEAVKIISKDLYILKYNTEHNEIVLLSNVFNFFHNVVKKSFIQKNFIFDFIKKRKINYRSVLLFNIGFIPKNVDQVLSKNIFNQNVKKSLIELGLLSEKTNKIYNNFKNRLIFPIRNIKGNYIGLGGRSIYDFIKPKYINSKDSFLFSKKKEFYGLYESKKNKTKIDFIIIVEGYIDVITLHQSGITNVIAILGTALSKEHLVILKLFYKKIIFCFDGDKAGKLASLRSAYLCLPILLDFKSINFIFLPDKLDPDLFIKKYGKENFLFFLKNGIFILDFIFLSLKITFNLNKKNNLFFLFKLNSLLSKIKNKLIKDFITNYFKEFISSKKKIFFNKKSYINSLGIKAFFILLKKKQLIKKIDIFKLISNKNIVFNSELNIFLELLFLLNNNINLNFVEINKRLTKKIIVKNPDFFYLLNTLNKDALENEFLDLIDKIQTIK